jgi:hypothetical protein
MCIYIGRRSIDILIGKKKIELLIVVLWVLMPCGTVRRYHRFGGTYRFHLQVEMKTTVDI